ncbi:hypothetical protein FRC17_005363 [Serendipita sp. 399]|nr:hypothetical protein FRC17_005363 [Serendipita sp. 399]
MSSTTGQVVWTPSATDLPPPRLRFRSTDNVVFHVHDNTLFPQSLALNILLGDYAIDEQPSTILPLNISSEGFKLILHFIYNAEFPREGWFYTGLHGVSLQTIHNAVSGCQQYMMHTVAGALEAPLSPAIELIDHIQSKHEDGSTSGRNHSAYSDNLQYGSL